MRSPFTLGIVYVALGGLSVSGIGGHRPLGVVPWVLAGLLVVAGVALFTRLRPAYYFAIAVAALTAVTGVLALAHHPELALPAPPAVSIVVGLYLIFRSALASSSGGADRKKAFIP
jgi:hypothetical protein